jgi:integrase/recombinase XerD
VRLAIVTRAKPDARGTLPLYVRLSREGLKRYVSLGIRIPERDWNERKREVRATNAHADQLNRILRERLATAEAAALTLQGRGRHFTADEAKEAVAIALHGTPEVEAVDAPDFFAYAEGALKRYGERGQVATSFAFGSAVNALREHVGSKALRWEAITPALLRAYVGHLHGRGIAVNTSAKYLGALRTIARRAEDDGIEGAAGAVRAIKAVKLRKERAERQRLTFDQVGELYALEANGWDFRRVARDTFTFAFFVGGMRFSDVITLTWGQVDTGAEPWRVRWRQRKTRDPHALPALGAARAILEAWRERTGPGGVRPSPYVFGLVTGQEDARSLRYRIANLNERVNRHLAKLCEEAGIAPVTYHVSRHSVADHLRRSGVDVYTISKALGHSTIQQTSAYLSSFDEADMDATLTRVLAPSPSGEPARKRSRSER